MSELACRSCCPSTTRCPCWSYLLRPATGASTDLPASFSWSINGSSSVPSISTTQARVPTLPTPDHLARGVGVVELLDQVPSRSCQTSSVAAQRLLDDRFEGLRPGGAVQLRGGDEQRRVADHLRSTVDQAGELRRRSCAVLGHGLLDRAVEVTAGLRARRHSPASADVVRRQSGVPHLQVAEGGELAHGLAVRRCGRAHHGRAVAVAEAPVTTGDREACDQTLDVPLPRPRKGLVEVVHVEDQPPVR